ncbi:MAG: ImmA/IrrE family metallo-endopeptidase [Pseudomarimonas sp.]
MSALSDRIVAARKAAGISQEAAARNLSISRPTYISIEKGVREVKPREMVLLADLFNTSVSALLRQGAPAVGAPHLRSQLSKSQGDVAVLDAVDKLAAFVDDYQFLLQRAGSHLAPVTQPRQSVQSERSIELVARRAAESERARLGLGDRDPVGNLRKTLDEVGVHVFVDALDSKLAGLYAYVPDFGYCILVNRKHPIERMRWTVAHEYGHFLFDRDEPGIDYLATPQRKPLSERRADAFAANFLMPASGIWRQFEECKALTGDVKVGDLCRIADVYGVSLMAVTLRMEDLGLVSKGTWDYIKSTGAKIQDLKREAGIDQSSNVESIETFPERYIILAIEAWKDDHITTAQFAKLLRRSPIEAREIAAKRSQSADDTGEHAEVFSVSLNASVLERPHSNA